MKTLFKLFTFFLLVNSSQLFSQTTHFEVKESKKYIDQFSKTSVLGIYSTKNNLNIVARKSKNNLVFETFDENAKGKKILTVKTSKKEIFVGELMSENTLRIFMVESPTKKIRILKCYTYHIDTNTSQKKVLLEKEVKKKSPLFSGGNKRQTNFSISPNNNFIAIAIDNIKKNSNSYDIYVYNANDLTLAYTKNYFNNEEKYYTSSDMAIDDNGIVYTIGKEYYKGKRERKKNKANYSYIICKIDENNLKTGAIELTKDEYIKDLNLSFYDNQLRFIGYYSEDKVFGIKGVSLFDVDINNLTVINKKKQKLPIKVFEDLYGYRKVSSKKDSELTSFYLDHTLTDSKNNTYLVAEEFYITQTYVNNGMNGGGYFITTYHYNDILITKLDQEGNLVWGRSLFKRANEPSYNAFLHNDELHVLLNSGKNLSKKNDGRLKVSRGWFESSSLYLFLFDESGNVSHEKIQDNKGKTFYIPYRGSYTDGKFVMYNHSKNKKQVMMLKCLK